LNVSVALETIVIAALHLAAVSPLVVVGLRGRISPDRLRLVGLSALVVVLTLVATCLPEVFDFNPAGLHWNWAGKLACVSLIVLLAWLLPRETLAKTGLLRLPRKDSLIPVSAFLAFCTLLGWASGDAPELPATGETLAFQFFMPSLAEEPVFRGILPALLSTAMGSPWRLGRAQLGWWWLVTSALDAFGHGFFWTVANGFELNSLIIVLNGLIALLFGWLAARCGSIWPCVVGHGLINSTGLAAVLIMR
jgi:hypothetical protein